MKEEVIYALQKKADQIRAGTELLVAKTRDWQMIKAYISNREEIELTPEQQEKYDRYKYIYNQLVCGKYTENDVLNQVQRIYKVKLTQAYEDLKCSREIFNTVLQVNKKFEQKMLIEAAKDMMRKCIELCDMRAAAAVQKNLVMLLKDLPEEIENPGELFEGHTVEATFDPRLLGANDITADDMNDLLKTINEKRNKKISTDMFEDIPFVDLPDENTAPL